MQFTKAALSLAASLLLVTAQPPSYGTQEVCDDLSEYNKLGCPANTTKPCASWMEQMAVLNDFTYRLYELQQVHQVFDEYVACNYLNHAPEVSGPGRDVAADFLAQSLPGGNVTLKRRTVGYNESGAAFGTTHFEGYNSYLGFGDIMYIQRFIGTCIVEGWDVAEAVNYTSTQNPIAYF
ncbi:hypothetical protein MMC10_000110 [Thelotrema lepadinum]|nr:hypothetical protein [Thelotrema lepadinum]